MGRVRSALAFMVHFGDAGGVTADQQFDRAILKIADPAVEPVLFCGAFGPIAVAHILDAAVNR